MQTLLFQACLPTRQNGVENRDKAYFVVDLYLSAVKGSIKRLQHHQKLLNPRVSDDFAPC